MAFELPKIFGSSIWLIKNCWNLFALTIEIIQAYLNRKASILALSRILFATISKFILTVFYVETDVFS